MRAGAPQPEPIELLKAGVEMGADDYPDPLPLRRVEGGFGQRVQAVALLHQQAMLSR